MPCHEIKNAKKCLHVIFFLTNTNEIGCCSDLENALFDCILIYMKTANFMLMWVEHEKTQGKTHSLNIGSGKR